MKHRRFLDNEGTMQARGGYEASVKKLLSAEPRNVPSKGNLWKGRILLIQLPASVRPTHSYYPSVSSSKSSDISPRRRRGQGWS